MSPPGSPISAGDRLSRVASSRSNRTTRLIGKLAVEEPDASGHFQLDADTDVKNRDDQVQQLKSHLKKLSAAVRRLNTDALRAFSLCVLCVCVCVCDRAMQCAVRVCCAVQGVTLVVCVRVGHAKASNAFAQDGMDKLQIAEKRSNPESVYGA
jgi:Flp pilus assembly protein TadB